MRRIGILWILLIGLLSSPVFSNAAPPVWDGESGVVVFDGKNGVALHRAHIRYTLQEARSDVAAVHVIYELENLEQMDRELLLYFMHAGVPEAFTVALDGKKSRRASLFPERARSPTGTTMSRFSFVIQSTDVLSTTLSK